MRHLSSISRPLPAQAQAGSEVLEKIAEILGIFNLFLFIRCELLVSLGKAEICPPTTLPTTT